MQFLLISKNNLTEDLKYTLFFKAMRRFLMAKAKVNRVPL